ncbi:MAG: aminopeptidase [Lachnospiraceae bacterium]|nr:aminopeptidase [Lachnospiraceae bacterium]
MEQDMTFIKERYDLCVERIREIAKEPEVPEKYQDYFKKEAEFISDTAEYAALVASGEYAGFPLAELEQWNDRLYQKILPENYETSYANPAYAVKKFGVREGRVLSALSAKYMELVSSAAKQKLYFQTIVMELFLEIYGRYAEYDEFAAKDAKAAFKSFQMDYRRDYLEYSIQNRYNPEQSFAREIVLADTSDERTLYRYGDYITDIERKTAAFLNKLSEQEIDAMADTYVEGYIRGFETMGVVRKENGVAVMLYPIGFERMAAAAVDKFEKHGVRVSVQQSARGRNMATTVNQQYEYDHRQDYALCLDRVYVNRYLEDAAAVYEENKELVSMYIGPAVVETFGEPDFEPVNKKEAAQLDKRQIKLDRELDQKYSAIAYTYIKNDETSFTIIAYPVPSIGDNFEEIFAETVRCNTLSNEVYTKIQQTLIDELDTGYGCKILGADGNETDLTVMLMELHDPAKETKFENCTADVNIPVGEVFTSPVLAGTTGLLHVSKVFLNGYEYKNLKVWFENGKTTKLSCENFATEEENQNFLSENLLHHHEWLPLGEFAIGTNTTAFVMGEKFDIAAKLPILIAEKTGPHFAIGDTCYKRSEDHKVYNRDGKEIIARDNEISLLRKTEPEKAYLNCHTDITIPYGEIGEISSLKKDGSKTVLIQNGRFVLPGTEELNKPLEEYGASK